MLFLVLESSKEIDYAQPSCLLTITLDWLGGRWWRTTLGFDNQGLDRLTLTLQKSMVLPVKIFPISHYMYGLDST